MQIATVKNLYVYPVKGLSAQELEEVKLEPGKGFPSDRMFGFARHDSGFDPNQPTPLPKHKFLMLMLDERLAGLDTHFDDVTRSLTVKVAGREVMAANLSTEDGLMKAEDFFARMFDLSKDETPQFVHADPHRFTDVSVVSSDLMNAVSLINLASVAKLEEVTGNQINPARFRGNIYFDGWPPFSELELVGKSLRIGDAQARITLRTRRCAATEVNPDLARRDMPIPRLLVQHFDHSDMGVYAEIEAGATIRSGDKIELVETAA